MKISLQWLKTEWLEGLGIPDSAFQNLTAEKIAEILTFRGIEVEEIQDLSLGLDQVVSAKILEQIPHPNADHLSVCKVQNDEGIFDVVCGAKNMKVGDVVAMAKIGAQLPNGLKIRRSKIRSVDSFGMLCSEEELKLADRSEGILILPPTTEVGRPLAEILGRNDTILNLKITANRGDCLSYQGIARELFSALAPLSDRSMGLKRLYPKPFSFAEFSKGLRYDIESQIPLTSSFQIKLDAGGDAPQFAALELSGVCVKPSSTFVRRKLESAGMRSINNIVDATNLVMLELGHPVHAYDASKLHGNTIGVRNSHPGEKLKLLDDTELILSGSELVIFDGQGAIGLAGIMGGAQTQVTETTTRVLLECAEFSPSRIRKTATQFSKKSEASYRFERGIDSGQVKRVLMRLVQLIRESGCPNAKIEGFAYESIQNPVPKSIYFNTQAMNAFLGTSFTNEESQTALEGLGFQLHQLGATGTEFTVEVSYHRRDISISEDLYEEVARVLGYDRIPETLPPLRTFPTSRRDDAHASRLLMISKIQDRLCSLGLNETIHFAFTSAETLKKAGLSSDLKLMNPISSDLSLLNTSLIPLLLENALQNQNHHFGSEILTQPLFEIRPVYVRDGLIQATDDGKTGIIERLTLSILMTGLRFKESLKSDESFLDFYDLKGTLESLFSAIGTKGVRFSALEEKNRSYLGDRYFLFHPGQSSFIRIGADDAGAFGVLHPEVQSRFKLKGKLLIAEIDAEVLIRYSRPALDSVIFKAIPEFPPIERDFALVVDTAVTADSLVASALKAGKPLIQSARVFDVYQGAQVGHGKKSLAIRCLFQSHDRSLEEAEVEELSFKLIEAFKKDLGAALRS